MPILFALDRTEGSNEGSLSVTGKLVLTCTLDKCKHQADYTAAAVSRFRKPTEPTKTPETHETSKSRTQKHRS
jgi:hypothetical protein